MNDDLTTLRKKVEDLDQKLLALLQERTLSVRKIGKVKQSMGLPVENREFEMEKLEKYALAAESMGVNPELVQNIFEEIFWDSKQQQGY